MVRIYIAFGMNSAAPWEMVPVSGLVTLVLGAMIPAVRRRKAGERKRLAATLLVLA